MPRRKLENVDGVHECGCGEGVFDEHDRDFGTDQRGSQVLDTAPPPPPPAGLREAGSGTEGGRGGERER